MKLANLLEVNSFQDIVGQSHLTEDNALLNKIILSATFDSLIFTGPPGTGKTSMAKLAGIILKMDFYPLHATTDGAADLKKLVNSIQKQSIVFIDEIHRYNKSQQDLLLKLIDEGKVKLIGASAENPYFNLSPALRSRSLIFEFKPLDDKDLLVIMKRAIPHLKSIFSATDIICSDDVINYILSSASGDGRRFINMLELSAMIGDRLDDKITLSVDGLDNILSKRRYNDDEHADLFSAMIKSIRGSDPDAALLWALKLHRSGVQIEAIYRRLMISASEDIGNAYPDAVSFISNSYNNYMNVGLPEGLIIFSHAVTYLASVPKSNKSYESYHAVMAYLDSNDPQVPANIRHNEVGYKYPFKYGDFVEQNYLPIEDKKPQFYYPSQVGFEFKITERLEKLWKSIKSYG